MVKISESTLEKLPNGVGMPATTRNGSRVGIVHFGVGGFHRAHQAVYVDELMRSGKAQEWGICGVGVLPGDCAMAEVLRAQDGLYTLVIKNADGSTTPRVIGSLVRYLYAPEEPDAVLEQLTDPGVRIVSLTITEGGYHVEPGNGEFQPSAELLADAKSNSIPQTVFGYVVEALRRRRDGGVPAFTVQSCDNVFANGDVAKKAVIAFAELADPELATWIAVNVAFPKSMVDRITPRTTDDDRAALVDVTGIEDGWPVVCEPWTQWVVEDEFPTGRPPYEDVGVQFVEDVEPYELMKMRLLNSGHQVIAYLGYLLGHRYAHEACADEPLAGLLRRYLHEEAEPVLRPVPAVDLTAYQRELIDRFANPYVGDSMARLCARSSTMLPTFLLPVVREQLRREGPIELATTVVAGWARYAESVDELGQTIDLVDDKADELRRRADAHGENITAFIDDNSTFVGLADDERFREVYARQLTSLREHGTRATLEALR